MFLSLCRVRQRVIFRGTEYRPVRRCYGCRLLINGQPPTRLENKSVCLKQNQNLPGF